jgi:hypothetical protein
LLQTITRWLRKRLYAGYDHHQPLIAHSQLYERTFTSIRSFYGILAVLSINAWQSWPRVSSSDYLNPPLPFSFIKLFPAVTFEYLLEFFPLLTISCFFLAHIQKIRLLITLLLVIIFAYRCSFGHNYHGELLLIYVAIPFALIPSWTQGAAFVSRKKKHFHILLYWFGFFLFLLPYTISGLWKLGNGMVWQLFFETKSFWSFDSMSSIISAYSSRTDKPAILADFVINNRGLGYPLLIFGTYWEVIAVLPAFRPQHWRSCALLVLSFHLLSLWLLNINFYWSFFFALFCIYQTPLYQPPKNLYEWLKSLPLFGIMIKRIGFRPS